MSGATVSPNAAPPMQRHRVHKGRRVVPGQDPRVDTLLGMVMALTSELAVLRERLDTHERLAAQGMVGTPDAVDAFVADTATEQMRAAKRKRMIEKVCRPLLAAASSVAAGAATHDD
jgi:hypothetical protein